MDIVEFSMQVILLSASGVLPEIKGGLKALKEKGLKITNYKEEIPKPRRR